MKELLKEMSIGDYASVLGCIIGIVAVNNIYLNILFAGIFVTIIFILIIRVRRSKRIRGEIKVLEKEKDNFVKEMRIKLLSMPSPYEIVEIKNKIEEFLNNHRFDIEAKILLNQVDKLIEFNDEYRHFRTY